MFVGGDGGFVVLPCRGAHRAAGRKGASLNGSQNEGGATGLPGFDYTMKDSPRGVKKCTNLLKLAARPEIIVAAYKACSLSKGAGTPGYTSGVVTDLLRRDLEVIGKDVATGRYKFSPARRVLIPKPSGGKRPLTIPSVEDRVVLQAFRIVLEPLVEGKFLDCSHGFRPLRRCESAINYMNMRFLQCDWFIEGDIKNCFGDITLERTLEALREHVDDIGAEDFLRKAFKAGYVVDDFVHVIKEDALIQGSPLSPLLANLVMHKLDVWVESARVSEEWKLGNQRSTNAAYKRL